LLGEGHTLLYPVRPDQPCTEFSILSMLMLVTLSLELTIKILFKIFTLVHTAHKLSISRIKAYLWNFISYYVIFYSLWNLDP
jgi:hypothetical protein